MGARGGVDIPASVIPREGVESLYDPDDLPRPGPGDPERGS